MADKTKDTTNELVELETVEVSLVDKGANRRTFAIRKSQETKKMTIVDAILQAPFDKSSELIEKLKKAELSEQAVEGVKSALQLLSAFQEELPQPLISEMMALIGMNEEKQEETEDEKEEKQEGEAAEEAATDLAAEAAEAEEDEEATDKGYKDKDKEKEMQKRLAALPDEMRGMVEQLWKSNKTEIAKRQELEAQVKKAEKEKRLSNLIKKAESDFSSLPAKPEELAIFIDGLNDDASSFAQALLKSANQMISAGNITSEIGKSNTEAQELDTISKAETMANEIAEKEGVTLAVAKGRVWKDNPDLYAAYQQEKRGK